MAEYIERGEVINLLLEYGYDSCWSAIPDFERLPAADVAPVRHGRWEHHYHDSGSPIDDKWYCSECNMCNGHKRTWYCPNCGAKMGGGKDNEGGADFTIRREEA